MVVQGLGGLADAQQEHCEHPGDQGQLGEDAWEVPAGIGQADEEACDAGGGEDGAADQQQGVLTFSPEQGHGAHGVACQPEEGGQGGPSAVQGDQPPQG